MESYPLKIRVISQLEIYCQIFSLRKICIIFYLKFPLKEIFGGGFIFTDGDELFLGGRRRRMNQTVVVTG